MWEISTLDIVHLKIYKLERMSLKRNTIKGLYLWGYIKIENISHLNQLNMTWIGSGICVPIECARPKLYNGMFKCLYIYMIVLMSGLLSLFVDIHKENGWFKYKLHEWLYIFTFGYDVCCWNASGFPDDVPHQTVQT